MVVFLPLKLHRRVCLEAVARVELALQPFNCRFRLIWHRVGMLSLERESEFDAEAASATWATRARCARGRFRTSTVPLVVLLRLLLSLRSGRHCSGCHDGGGGGGGSRSLLRIRFFVFARPVHQPRPAAQLL